MLLKEWLEQNNLNITAFAKNIEYERVYISVCMHGHRKPGKKFINAVEKFTCGLVKKEDWNGLKKDNNDQMQFNFQRDEKGKFTKKEAK
jgi:hypothetical protein